jgi:hypothetical protein
LVLGILANVITVTATLVAMPAIIEVAQSGGEPDERTAMMFGLALFAVLGTALLGLVLSIIGTVISQKKLVSILGILFNVLPPFTYIAVCAAIGVYMAATGQM